VTVESASARLDTGNKAQKAMIVTEQSCLDPVQVGSLEDCPTNSPVLRVNACTSSDVSERREDSAGYTAKASSNNAT
jgi:hypothetical protein